MGIIGRLRFLWNASAKTTRIAFFAGVPVVSAMSISTWIWDELLPKHPRPKLILILPHWPWCGWALAVFAIATATLLDHVYTQSVPQSVILRADGNPFSKRVESAVFQHSALTLIALTFVLFWGWDYSHPHTQSSQLGNVSIAVSSAPAKQIEAIPDDTPHKLEGKKQGVQTPHPHASAQHSYKIDVGGVIFSTFANNNDVRVQLTVTVNNPGSSSFAHDWSLIAKFPSRVVKAEHLIGDVPVQGSVNLPALDGQQFTADKPAYGLLYFMLPRLTPDEINELRNCQPVGSRYPVLLDLKAQDGAGAVVGTTQIPMDELLGQRCTGQGSMK